MLQPFQLKQVSAHYANEIAELRDFLAKSGMSLDTAETLPSVAARLREDLTFRRDLKSHLWVAMHDGEPQPGYSEMVGMLAIAAAGPHFAADADDQDAHDLLRFVMEARSSFGALPSTGPRPALFRSSEAAALPLIQSQESFARQEPADSDRWLDLEMPQDSSDRRPLLWLGAAACLFVAFLIGLSFHHSSGADKATPVASTTATPAAAPPASVSASRSEQPTQQRSEVVAGSTPRPAAVRNRHRVFTASRPESGRSLPEMVATAPEPPAPASSRPVSTAATPVAESPQPSRAQPSRLLRKLPPATRGSSARSKPNAIARVNPAATPAPPASIPAGGLSREATVRPTSLGIMAANVLYSPAPAYPTAASAEHVQGEVRLEAEVDRDGSVVSTRIISGPPLLRDAAADAVQSWRYRPYLYEGKPIAMNATVVMDFQLP